MGVSVSQVERRVTVMSVTVSHRVRRDGRARLAVVDTGRRGVAGCPGHDPTPCSLQHLHPHRAAPHLWSGMILEVKGDHRGAALAYNRSRAVAMPYDWQVSVVRAP